jgi:superfamily II DNA or RNA helicase
MDFGYGSGGERRDLIARPSMHDNSSILSPGLPVLRYDQGVIALEGYPGDPGRNLGIKWKHQTETNRWVAFASEYRKAKKEGLNDLVPAWQELEPLGEAFLHTPRGAQVEAISAWKAAKAGMVWMPTGTGKTEVALHIIRDMGVSALIVAPTRDMMYQWQRRIETGLGYQSGLIGDQYHTVKPISVATYHSACIHMPRLGNRFQLIVFDEVHHLPGPVRGDASRMCAAPMRLGLTATPPEGSRLNDLIELAGPPLFHQQIHEATGDSLAEYQIVKCPVEMTGQEREKYDELGKIVSEFFAEKRKNGFPKYSTQDLGADAARNRKAKQALRAYHRRRSMEARAASKLEVLEDLFLLHPTEPTIIWTANNLTAREISKQFLIPCILSHCARDERRWIVDGFEAGKFKAIVTCELLTEGVDVPKAKVGISLGGDSSQRKSIQRLGRILRKTGNAHAIYYDVFCSNSSDETRAKARRPKFGEKVAKASEEFLC